MKRRTSFKALSPSYLFPEVQRRKEEYEKKHPAAEITSLGVGDTVLPLPPSIAAAMARAGAELGTAAGYIGYGKDQGSLSLREKICSTYYPQLSVEEIFVSDGAKCDVGRLQLLFGGDIAIGLQDPAYPVYLDGSIIQGATQIHFLPCQPDNHFFPELRPDLDLLYICNPNNPTGAAYTHCDLEKIVSYALEHRIVILYDGAYAAYIQDPTLPKTIYAIPGAEKVAIEVNSFSKLAGFTGVRLGWTVVPKQLVFECGHSIWKDYCRLYATLFNGASNIAQRGGLAVFSDEGWEGIQRNISYTMDNAKKLKEWISSLGYHVYGGENAPYVWAHAPGEYSWDIFQEFMEKRHLIVTPGRGYGPAGEHFFRLSAFAKKEAIAKVTRSVEA